MIQSCAHALARLRCYWQTRHRVPPSPGPTANTQYCTIMNCSSATRHKPTCRAKIWAVSQVTEAPDKRLVCDMPSDWGISAVSAAFDS